MMTRVFFFKIGISASQNAWNNDDIEMGTEPKYERTKIKLYYSIFLFMSETTK